jgi:cytochrome P450
MSANPDSRLSLMNLLRPELRANPYPFYAQLRAQDPVHWDEPMGFWVLTRYAEVASVYHDRQFSRAEGLRLGFEHALEDDRVDAEPVYRAFSKMVAYADPPYHTRLRGLANKAFTPRAVERMRPHIQQIVDELLDAAESNGELDVIRDLAAPLPIIVIAEMLGLPRGDRQHFKQWSDDAFAVLGVVRRSPELMRRASESLGEMSEYFNALSDARRSSPREDLLSALVAAEEEGNRLTRDELVANVGLLLSAGHETTTNLIGNGVLALLQHPDQLEKLRADPALAADAVEEVMRYDNPAQIAYRSATEDVQVGGQCIRKGQVVNLMLGAANRDPAQFSHPDRFDLERRELKHVGLGLGIHYCLGAPLARLEGQIAFNTLLRRFPKLRLAGDQLEWHEHPTFHGLKALPVAF